MWPFDKIFGKKEVPEEEVYLVTTKEGKDLTVHVKKGFIDLILNEKGKDIGTSSASIVRGSNEIGALKCDVKTLKKAKKIIPKASDKSNFFTVLSVKNVK